MVTRKVPREMSGLSFCIKQMELIMLFHQTEVAYMMTAFPGPSLPGQNLNY